MSLKVKFGKILHHDVCLVAHVKFSQTENHFIDCKIGPQNHKMNYTRNLPSNSVLWTKNLKRDWSKRDRESSKRKPREGTAGDGLCHPSTHGPVVVHASHSADPSLILTDPSLVLVLRWPIFLLIDSYQAKRTRERATQGQRERGQSPELEIDSTAVWAVPLTADKKSSTSSLIYPLSPFLPLPPISPIYPFSLYPCQANHRKSSKPLWPNCLCHAICLPFPQTISLSLFLSLSLSSFLSQFDRIWWMFLFGFVSFVFIYWEMILYIYLEAKNVNNQ